MIYGVGKSGRKIVMRLVAGDDMWRCILKAYHEAGFKNAVITTCVGSLKTISFAYAVVDEDDTNPLGMKYHDVIHFEGIGEVVSMNGVICEWKGETVPHFHMTFIDQDGAIHCGHIFDEGNIVFATMEICMEEVEGITIERRLDEVFKVPFLHVIQDK